MFVTRIQVCLLRASLPIYILPLFAETGLHVNVIYKRKIRVACKEEDPIILAPFIIASTEKIAMFWFLPLGAAAIVDTRNETYAYPIVYSGFSPK